MLHKMMSINLGCLVFVRIQIIIINSRKFFIRFACFLSNLRPINAFGESLWVFHMSTCTRHILNKYSAYTANSANSAHIYNFPYYDLKCRSTLKELFTSNCCVVCWCYFLYWLYFWCKCHFVISLLARWHAVTPLPSGFRVKLC